MEGAFSEVHMQDFAQPRSLAILWSFKTSRLLKAYHHMLRIRIKMRSGACAAPRQHANRRRGGVPGLKAPDCWTRPGRPDLDVYRSQFEPLTRVLGPSGPSRTSSALEGRLGGFEKSWNILAWGR